MKRLSKKKVVGIALGIAVLIILIMLCVSACSSHAGSVPESDSKSSHYKAISLLLIFSWINSELYQKIAFKWIHGKKQLEFLAFNRVPFFLGKKHAFHLYT